MNRVLSPAQALQYQAAMQSLTTRKPEAALRIARELARLVPRAADAQQLLGMCLGENGLMNEAQAAFEYAMELAPNSMVVAENFALFLIKKGKSLRTKKEFWLAIKSLRRAVQLAPLQGSGWAELGLALRFSGDIEAALRAFQRARELGIDSPGLRDAINGTLQDAGHISEALAGARQLVVDFPAFSSGYETLSNILWENGRKLGSEEDPLEVFRAAAQVQSGNRELRLKFVRMLLSAKRGSEALEVLQPMRKREPRDPLLDWYAADAMESLGQSNEASVIFSRIAPHWNNHAAFLNSYTRHAFRMKQLDLAHSCAQRSIQVDPYNQEAWANLGIVWRLWGDEREYWLFDYENLVAYIEVATPPGYANLTEFLAVLRETLDTMHLASGEPVNQSVMGGSQTPGRLFGRSDPVLRAAQEALQLTVENWQIGLPEDDKHPFLSRKQVSAQMVGSWSICLFTAGRHSNHIHNQGWMSSAFHVSLPDAVYAGSEERAGWIQFGSPLEALGLELPPRRIIQPRPGYLALFPSYMWHGTIPFTDVQPRLTIAFDMQPAVEAE